MPGHANNETTITIKMHLQPHPHEFQTSPVMQSIFLCEQGHFILWEVYAIILQCTSRWFNDFAYITMAFCSNEKQKGNTQGVQKRERVQFKRPTNQAILKFFFSDHRKNWTPQAQRMTQSHNFVIWRSYHVFFAKQLAKGK